MNAFAHTPARPPAAVDPGDAAPAAAPRPFRDAVRIQRSVLTSLEMQALRWLAVRIPPAVNSDHLTLLALLAMIGVGASYWLASVTPLGLVLAIVLLAVNWFGDSLDGTVARIRGHQRPRYGYYVDHVVDVVGVTFLFGGLALSGLMQVPIAAALLLAYFLVSLEVYLATHSLGEFHMSFFGVGPTELRILLAVGNVAVLLRGNGTVFGLPLTLFDVAGVVATACLIVTFVVSAVRNARTLYRAEPLPRRDDR